MKCCNAYESNSMIEITGDTIRPGGFKLTEKGFDFCSFKNTDVLLDLGCGTGATIGYLYEKYNISASGIDPSEKLLDSARKKYTFADFKIGIGENLPYENDSFNGVFAECTLSLINDLESTLSEVYRVLKDQGYFIINDVYAANPEHMPELNNFKIKSCIRGLHDLNVLKQRLERIGFNIIYFEDCSNLLKELLVKIIFLYGSMSCFWSKTADNCINGSEFHEILKLCKPGYFMLIAQKGGKVNG